MRKKNNLLVSALMISFVLSFAISVYGMYMFSMGYMHFDYGHNLRYLNSEFDLNLGDVVSSGKYMSPESLIIYGVNMLKAGLFLMISGSLMFGYFVLQLELFYVNYNEREKK